MTCRFMDSFSNNCVCTLAYLETNLKVFNVHFRWLIIHKVQECLFAIYWFFNRSELGLQCNFCSLWSDRLYQFAKFVLSLADFSSGRSLIRNDRSTPDILFAVLRCACSRPATKNLARQFFQSRIGHFFICECHDRFRPRMRDNRLIIIWKLQARVLPCSLLENTVFDCIDWCECVWKVVCLCDLIFALLSQT